MTQEVIAYRNQAEADFWHALYSGDLMHIFVGLILALIVFLSVYWAVTQLRGPVEKVLEHRHVMKGQGRLPWPTRMKIRKVLACLGVVAGLATVARAARLF